MSGGPNSWNWAGIEDLVGHMQGMVNRTDEFLNLLNDNVRQLADESEGDTIVGTEEMHELTSNLTRENSELVTQLSTTLMGSSENMQGVSQSGYSAVTGT